MSPSLRTGHQHAQQHGVGPLTGQPCYICIVNQALFSAIAVHNLKKNKKFELMLTKRAKAYSSSCSQTVSLSPAISSRLLRGYRFLMPSGADFLEPRKSRLVYLNWFRRNSLLKCVSQPEIVKKSTKPLFSVQGHPRSLNSAPIESQCMTSY